MPDSHILMIGCTGMLREVVTWAAQHYSHITLIARNRNRLHQIQSQLSVYQTPIQLFPLNYCNNKQLGYVIENAQIANGKFTAALTWIQSKGENAIPVIANELNKNYDRPNKIPWYDVRSSAITQPGYQNTRAHLISQFTNISYRQIILGFQLTKNGSRWLTHSEIVSGTIDAIQLQHHEQIIGRISPWHLRP